MRGDSNEIAFTGAEVFPCSRSVLPILWCSCCLDVQPAGCSSLFRSTSVFYPQTPQGERAVVQLQRVTQLEIIVIQQAVS